MIIDGKQIAEDIYTAIRAQIATLPCAPILTIITCTPNFETKKYLALKEKKAHALGMETRVVELEASSTTNDFQVSIHNATRDSDAIIVQLPLPPHVDRDAVTSSVPPSHDADALNPKTTMILSPVVASIKKILELHSVRPSQKFVTIIGSGKLVGLPSYDWFVKEGSFVSLVTKDTIEIEKYTMQADIIVCGAGASGLLTPSMIKEGVIILDAGTSEDGGELKGDADPLCAEKASLFTPVPGGIGPITIAVLLRNVVDCAKQKLA